jgi:L-alanine-DL-glutamate epimerase-like enolase superfamily enzyme
MSTPTITQIDVYKLSIRLQKPFRISLGVEDTAKNILVKIQTSDGQHGLGEGPPFHAITGETQGIAFEAARAFAQLLIGENPMDIETRMLQLNAFVPHNTAAKCAFDMALYDLLGKYAGLPLYALLGGPKRTVHTDLTIGIDTPEVMAQEALSIQKRGFPAIKVKLGTTRANDLARIQAIRDAVGPAIPLRIDANQGWDASTAVLTLNDLAPYGIQYCEEPVAHWNNQAMKYVREHSPIAIVADESVFDHHDALRLASMGACDYFNIKLSKAGGIHTALKINGIAEGAGIHCMVGCMTETRLALTAAAHFVSARPNVHFADLDGCLNLAEDPVDGGITYDGGAITLPDAPGHGADIKPDFLETLEGVSISA